MYPTLATENVMLNENVLQQIEQSIQGGKVILTGTKLDLKCPKCSHSWGVHINPISGELPYRWDVCVSCVSRERAMTRRVIENLGKETVE
jgi:hypothetical protein